MYRHDIAMAGASAAPATNRDEMRLREGIDRLARAGEATMLRFGQPDPITGLPTRSMFTADFATVVESGYRSLILVTLTDGRHYNELQRALGHAYSEDFIRAGAARLASLLPPETTLYHVSLLTFGFFSRDSAEPQPPALVKEIVRAFRVSLVCSTIPIDARAGVGVAGIGPGMAPGELLRATLAAAQDSRKGFAGWATYDRGTDEAHLRAFRLLSDLPAALRTEGELVLHFQPRIAMQEGTCTGAEALLRWNHPEFGAVSPGEFVPLAESTALISSLTRWVVTSGLRTAARWRDAGRELRLAINVSPRNLEEAHFVEFLTAEMNRYDIDPTSVELEFTEGTLAANTHMMLDQLGRLKRMGFAIAIDDFGSGYSNMGMLGTLPASVLKIDKSLVFAVEKDRRKQLLVRSIIQLAHALDFEVVAEGIETREAFGMLCGWDCDGGQGFFMSRALPLAEFDDWFARRGSRQIFYD